MMSQCLFGGRAKTNEWHHGYRGGIEANASLRGGRNARLQGAMDGPTK